MKTTAIKTNTKSLSANPSPQKKFKKRRKLTTNGTPSNDHETEVKLQNRQTSSVQKDFIELSLLHFNIRSILHIDTYKSFATFVAKKPDFLIIFSNG